MVSGDTRDPAALARLIEDSGVVVSALGPSGKSDTTLHRDSATALIGAVGAGSGARTGGM